LRNTGDFEFLKISQGKCRPLNISKIRRKRPQKHFQSATVPFHKKKFFFILKKIAEGRFGQVYKAKIGDRFLAVKQFVDNGEDSWTNEMVKENFLKKKFFF